MRRFLIIAVLLSSCVGPAGEDGRDGSDSSGMRISVTRRCYLDIDHLALSLAHDVFSFSDGSVLSTCSVALPEGAYSGTNMLRANTALVETGFCSVGADLFGVPSHGYVTFEAHEDQTLATYHDPEDTHEGESWGMPCDVF